MVSACNGSDRRCDHRPAALDERGIEGTVGRSIQDLPLFRFSGKKWSYQAKVDASLVATPSEIDPTEPSISGVEVGYIDRIRSTLNGQAPYVFAKRAGISKSYMYEVLSGSKAPSLAFFSALAEITGVRADWLISGRGMPNEGWNGRTALIPRMEINRDALPADSGSLMLVENNRLGGVPATRAAAIGAPDNGMAPLIEVGDDLIVELHPAVIADDQIYLIQIDKRFVLRRLKVIDQDTVLMLSNSADPLVVSAERHSSKLHHIHSRVIVVSKTLG